MGIDAVKPASEAAGEVVDLDEWMVG